ncbi:MAG: hypothetical protein STSR0009_13760 [Methanoregula sp.]
MPMVNNINTLIGKIKDNAVARCRERIELAADKARGVLSGNKPEDSAVLPPKKEPPGMTSCLKRQHGL